MNGRTHMSRGGTAKAIANNVGVSKAMAPRHMVMIQSNTLTPAGSAMSIVVNMKEISAAERHAGMPLGGGVHPFS